MYLIECMAIEDKAYYKFYLKHQKFIHAVEGILVILMLVVLNTLAYQNSKLNKEISANCGWGEDDYECYCQKSEAIALKNQIELDIGGEIDIDDLDIYEG